MFGKKDKIVYPRNKTVVVGLFERAGGAPQVRFGIGEYITEEIAGRKEESFRVTWEGGRVDTFPVPSYRDVFLRRDGGNVVFFYVQAPGVGVPISGPTNAIKRLRFQTLEEAQSFVEKLKEYNPRLDVEIKGPDKDGHFIVEFPVITFDIDRDIPLREAYSKMVMRMSMKFLRRGWWEKWGKTAVTIGTALILLIASIFGFHFVQKSYEHAEKVFQLESQTITKYIEMLSDVGKELNATASYLGTLVRAGVIQTPAPASAGGPPPG